MSVAKKLGLCVGSSIFIGYTIFTYCTMTGNTNILAFKDHLIPYIGGFIETVAPYAQNPMLIIDWFKQNPWIGGFVSVGAVLGGAVVKTIMNKAKQKAVETVETGFAKQIEQSGAKVEQAQSNLNEAMNKLTAKQTVIDAQDRLIKQVEAEKLAVHDMLDDKDDQIIRLSEERDYLVRRVAALETELKAKPKVP